MNDERVPWQAEDPESGAVQVGGRPVHALWSTIREHFRRVFLEPHRPAGSDKVGWRWVGGSAPRAPEPADLADLRQLLQHALLDLTADLERRAENPESASPKELLSAVQSIVHDLNEGTDIDLGTYAVETVNGWFIRSWGFSHPAPAKLVDPAEAAAEAAAESAAEAASNHEAAPPPPPPAPKRRHLGRWAAVAVVLMSATVVLVWMRSGAKRAAPASQPHASTEDVPAAHSSAHSTDHHSPTAQTTREHASVPGETAASEVSALGGALGTTTSDAPHAHAPAPGAQLGVMPELPGQTGEIAGAHSSTSAPHEAPGSNAPAGGAESEQSKSDHPTGSPGADAPQPAAPAAEHTSSPAHDGGHEAKAPAGGSGTVGLSPNAPPAPAKSTSASIDAAALPEIPPRPAIDPVNPAPEAAPTTPPEAQPASAATSATPPTANEQAPVTEVVWVNQNERSPAPPPPAPLVIFMPGPASHTTAGPGPAQAPLFTAGNDGGSHQAGWSESANANGTAATAAHSEEASPAALALAVAAAAKAKLRAASLTVAYQIGEPKVRLPRDTVLATQPTERASTQMMADARVQAWNNNQTAKPESFRKPVITGGWSFRPARGATWPKHPVWLDTLTGKPVEGLRVSTNGLHLTWNGLVPAEAFSAHILDEEGNEQARLTYTAAERRFEVTTNPVFAESSPVFTVELTSREAVAGTMVWRSRTPTWSDARWETQLQQRQIKLICLQPLPSTKEPVSGVVALSHPASGWILSWEVSVRPTATAAAH